MIARAWSGRTRKEDGEAYSQYVLETGIRGLGGTPGNRGAWLLCRAMESEIEFLVLSLWDSLESIEAFAGPDVERARYYPEDDKYLLEKAEKVTHYEVVHSALPH